MTVAKLAGGVKRRKDWLLKVLFMVSSMDSCQRQSHAMSTCA